MELKPAPLILGSLLMDTDIFGILIRLAAWPLKGPIGQ